MTHPRATIIQHLQDPIEFELHLGAQAKIDFAYLLRRALNTLDPQEYKDWNELADRLDYGRPLEGIASPT